jgi:D-beta-D-heptose 7-phosphate kinase/D-beta-D-heptose 1-phosphate adenosyltransferase
MGTEMIQRSALVPIVESFSGGAVLCVGDAMLDRYVYGVVQRISPEAPIPVLRVEREVNMLGGAGNVLRNLLALGVRASIATMLGDDGEGQELQSLLACCEEAKAAVTIAPERKTTVKTRFFAGNQQLLRCDQETVEPPPASIQQRILASATEMMCDHAVILVSDYAKGAVNGLMSQDVIGAARRLGKVVIIDPKGGDYDRYRGADVITPNRQELEQAMGKSLSPGQEADAAKYLADQFGFGAVIVTLGKGGMMLATRLRPTEFRRNGRGDDEVRQ